MARLVRLLALAVCLLLAGTAMATPIATLINELEHGSDFRVRVEAALELGKTHSEAALHPLEGALDDSNAAVRTAAAAALKVLGNKAAIPSLKQHRLDRSSAVRAQIRASLAALEGHHGKAKLLVKLGKIRDGAGVRSSAVISVLVQASRDKLGELPGVRVLDDSDDYRAAARRRDPPVVMVTGRLKRLGASRQGGEIVVSAKIEYVVHRMPQQSIAATVSGSASTTATSADLRDSARMAELKNAVLVAAVDSAIRRAPPALESAAQ
jgi:HEAT repeats